MGEYDKTYPTYDGGAVGLDPTKTPQSQGEILQQDGTLDKRKLVTTLEGYRIEAENNRKNGMNPRDAQWEENLNLYWNRFNWKDKANWQAQEVMPEVPSYVDRFAAALKEALVASPEGFYTVKDPTDQENDMAGAIKRMMDMWLSRIGRNQMGTLLPFSAVFEEQVKMGALMAMSGVVTWKGDVPCGRVAIETIDPRSVYLDHTYRNLYRIRSHEVDKHELMDMLGQKDGKGNPIYDLHEMHQLIGTLDNRMLEAEQVTGHGQQISSARSPITLDEYVATVLDDQGNKVTDRGLYVVANRQFLIRGPEKNPFWHGGDWLVYTPLVTTPLSVYGRSYMEDFGDIAHTFIELTNLILDAVRASALKAHAVVPTFLTNPEQIAEGITGGKTFFLEEGVDPKMFWSEVELGALSPDSLKMWQLLKQELSEAADMNEIGLGQFAPKGRTSATEIRETQQSSSALIRGVAHTVETRWLDPALDLTWKTGLQHMHQDDKSLALAAGPEMYTALYGQRKELIKRPISFQARGISAMIRKSQTLQSFVQLLGIVAQNDMLMQAFLQEVDMAKFAKKLFELSDLDITTVQTTQREKMIRGITEQMPPMTGAGPSAEGGTRKAMNGMAQAAGIGY